MGGLDPSVLHLTKTGNKTFKSSQDKINNNCNNLDHSNSNNLHLNNNNSLNFVLSNKTYLNDNNRSSSFLLLSNSNNLAQHLLQLNLHKHLLIQSNFESTWPRRPTTVS